LKMKDVLD